MNKEHKFHIEPRDLVFMRDARPMGASDAGLGGNWPRPDQIWNAFINTFHAKWQNQQDWEGHQHRYKPGIDNNGDSSFRFGALKSIGPFPVDEIKKKIYFPCPLDLSSDDDGMLFPMKLTCASGSNMPNPLRYAFSSSRLGKNEAPQWISSDDYSEYLKGNPFKPEKYELYDVERNIGIGIDPTTNSTIDGKLYQAEYLRLRHSTRMAVQVSCCLKGGIDVFREIAKEKNLPFVLGGQQGVALLNSPSHSFSLPFSCFPPSLSSPVFVRWILLSPAVYPEIQAHPGGWLPNWVDCGNGSVMLPRKGLPKKEGESRGEWRERIEKAEKFSARLVAARIGKPMAFSGWDLQTGPKPTQLAVPAGSCYVFECADLEEARDLSNALSWNGGDGDMVMNRRSTVFGEKGFGLGVCSILKYNECIVN